MGGETIHINLAKPVDAVKLKAGVPNERTNIRVFWRVWFG